MNVSEQTIKESVERLLLPPREAARALAISERTLWTFTQAGEIPAIRIGRSVRYDPADLKAWIAKAKAAGVKTDAQGLPVTHD